MRASIRGKNGEFAPKGQSDAGQSKELTKIQKLGQKFKAIMLQESLEKWKK